MATPDLAAHVRVIARDVDDQQQTLKTLRADVDRAQASADSAHRAIVRLSEATRSGGNSLTPDTPASSVKELPDDAVSWLTLTDAETASVVLAELEAWLTAVYCQYPGGTLPDCFRRHGWVVEELLALMDAHTAAWAGETGTPVARVDWHSRHRPDVAGRIRKALPNCGLTKHAPANAADVRIVGLVGIDDSAPVVGWWVSSHGTTAEPPPSPAALAESRARDDAEAQAQYG